MSWKEKSASKVIFSIDNNYYLISNIKIKKLLITIRNRYSKYIKNKDVMYLNVYKIKKAFFDEYKYYNYSKEKRGLKNIVDVFKEVLSNKKDIYFYEMVEMDYNSIINYLNFIE